MKLTYVTRLMLAYRKERRDMQAQGYHLQELRLHWNEKATDIQLSKDGRGVWVKSAAE